MRLSANFGRIRGWHSLNIRLDEAANFLVLEVKNWEEHGCGGEQDAVISLVKVLWHRLR